MRYRLLLDTGRRVVFLKTYYIIATRLTNPHVIIIIITVATNPRCYTKSAHAAFSLVTTILSTVVFFLKRLKKFRVESVFRRFRRAYARSDDLLKQSKSSDVNLRLLRIYQKNYLPKTFRSGFWR